MEGKLTKIFFSQTEGLNYCSMTPFLPLLGSYLYLVQVSAWGEQESLSYTSFGPQILMCVIYGFAFSAFQTTPCSLSI